MAYNANNGTVQLPDSGVGATKGLQKILTNSGVTGLASGRVRSDLDKQCADRSSRAFNKFGFIFDPTANCPTMQAVEATTSNQTAGNVYPARVRFFLNGQLLPWFLNTADVQAATFPLTYMVPVIGYRSGGTGTGIAYCDWIKVAQLGTY